MKGKSSYVNVDTGNMEEVEVDCFEDDENAFAGIDVDDDDDDWDDDEDDSVGVVRLLLIMFVSFVAFIGIFCLLSKDDE